MNEEKKKGERKEGLHVEQLNIKRPSFQMKIIEQDMASLSA